jgi:hypothetical protein
VRRKSDGVSKVMFQIEFDDESASATGRKNDRLSYQVSEEAHLSLKLVDGSPFLFGNRPGFLSLAKILVKIGLSEYKEGFHVHLRRDFSDDAEQPDAMTICLDSK